jgi:hypothetical protein
MVENKGLIPKHQFSFGHRHPAIEQTHWTVWCINKALENKQYCSATFLDISQACNTVWHTGLLYKLKIVSPSELFPYPKILFVYQTLPCKGWNSVHNILHSQCTCTPRQCLRAIIIPAIHCRHANLTRICHRNLCRWDCRTSHGQWSSHCFTETANQPTWS